MNISTPVCRSCGSSDLKPIISFGETTLADALLTADQLNETEYTAPLDLVFCPDCSLVQITVSVPPEILFCRNYPYFSSVSPSLMKHFRDSAEAIIADRQLDASSMVIEAASNDGYMLKPFAEKGIPVLGALTLLMGPAAAAEKKQVFLPAVPFFSQALAEQLSAEGHSADVFFSEQCAGSCAGSQWLCRWYEKAAQRNRRGCH